MKVRLTLRWYRTESLMRVESFLGEDRRYCFLFSKHHFQGKNLTPSNAVQGQDRNGFRNAVLGKTIFPFNFQLPEDAPSSLELGEGALRYVITGYVFL
jgi:hypothetical protein